MCVKPVEKYRHVMYFSFLVWGNNTIVSVTTVLRITAIIILSRLCLDVPVVCETKSTRMLDLLNAHYLWRVNNYISSFMDINYRVLPFSII